MPHVVPHFDVVRSHASSAGQSVGPLHPQTPPTHADPAALAAQLVQLGPHPSVCVSAAHTLPTQHVAAPHAPSPVCPHAAVHVPVAPQVGVPPAHVVHAAPEVPHAPLPSPPTHWPGVGSQQPPLHAVSAAPPQAVVHTPVVVLQASSTGQSVAVVQGPGASGVASTLASVAAASIPASIVASTAASCPAGASTPGLVSGKLVSGKLASAPGPLGVEEPKQPASATPVSVTTMVSTASVAVMASARSAPPRVPMGLI